jgi:hypothetical protein
MTRNKSDFSTGRDINDGKPWSPSDDQELINAVAAGASLDETATLLRRSGTLVDVARRALQLGLEWPRERYH